MNPKLPIQKQNKIIKTKLVFLILNTLEVGQSWYFSFQEKFLFKNQQNMSAI